LFITDRAMRNKMEKPDPVARRRASPASMAVAFALALVLAAVAPASAQQSPRSPKPPVAAELPDGSFELAFDLPQGYELRLAAWDPAGARAAVYGRAGKEYGQLWVDLGFGLEGPFQSVGDLVFSSDGRRVACSVQAGYDEYYVLEGDRRSGPWADVAGAAFSPDSTSFLFLGYSRDHGGTEVVVDMESRGRGNEPGFFAGSRWYFRSWEGGMSVVTDAGVSGPWTYVPIVRVSPDGSEILYSATDAEGRGWVCTSDRAYGPFLPFSQGDGIDGGIVMDLSALPYLEPGFSPDGRTPRYFVRERRDGGIAWTVYEGSTPVGGPWPEPAGLATFPVPSADFSRIAFVVRDGAKFYIEEGADRLGPFGDVRRLSYSADGSTFVAQVRGADWNGWIYGSGFMAGPYRYPDSWNLSPDGAFLRVEGGYRVGEEGSGWWTRTGELAEPPPGAAIAVTPVYPRYGPWTETEGPGTVVHGGSLSFGPYAGEVRVYAGTRSGGALYTVEADGPRTLYADGKPLLSSRDGSFDLDMPGIPDAVVPVMAEYRAIAWLVLAGGYPRGLTAVDTETGTGRWIGIGRDE